MKYGSTGENVRELQQALLAHGYKLPKYGDDGDFGHETMTALKYFTQSNNINWTSENVPEEVFVLFGIQTNDRQDPDVPSVPQSSLEKLNVEVIDMRHEQTDPPTMTRKFKRHNGKVVVRDPGQITGITIHQTAVKYSVAEYQIQASGGSRKLALARRALNVACHVMAFHDGFVVWANPLEWYVYHGNGFNSFELGIEIDGNYPGLQGGKTWNGKQATEVTKNVISAARKGVELLVIEGRKLGMPIEYIHAHRQSSATRRSDPGEELWNAVVVEFAVPILGLVTEPNRVLRDGMPIPREWDKRGVESY